MMTIEDILETDDIKAINEKTRISISNIERLIQKDFSSFKKVQALGLISILEREYGETFDDLRQASDEYFASLVEVVDISGQYIKDSSSSSDNKWFMLFLSIALIALAWFFYASVVKTNKQSVATPVYEDKNLSEENATNANVITVSDTNQTKELNTTTVKIINSTKIIPVKKLWFATIDLSTKKVSHHSLSEPFDANSTNETLIVTSVAPFSMVTNTGEQKYSDFKPHYFKVTTTGVQEITKKVFISNGGPKKLAQ